MMLSELLSRCPIAITGRGVWSAAGTTVPDFLSGVFEGRRPASWRHSKSGILPGRMPAFVAPRPAAGAEPFRSLRKMDWAVQMATAAGLDAWADSGACESSGEGRRAVVVGTSRGPMQKWCDAVDILNSGRRLPPTVIPASAVSAPSGALAAAVHAAGPCFTVSTTCASAALAISLAAEQILLGSADVALAGGTDAPLTDVLMASMETAGILGHGEDPAAICRPFDRDRTGLVLGEGAAFLVLERLDRARARGAVIHGLLAGWAHRSGDGGRSGVSGDSADLAAVISGGLDAAAVAPGGVDYINAHGTGTGANDRGECLAFRSVFGDTVPPFTSTKPFTGHCLGATPAMEAIICLEAMRRNMVPPVANFSVPDPACGLSPGGSPPTGRIGAVLSISLGFWSKLSALVLKAPEVR